MKIHFSSIAVVGAGAMGQGIAQIATQAGSHVWLLDSKPGAADKARQAIQQQWAKLAAKGRVTEEQVQAWSQQLQIANTLADLGSCQLVIEAVVERLEVKQALFAELERTLPANVVWATNTSSLSVTAIAAALQQPERLAGFHFFNPVPVMGLIEVIRGLQTSDATHALALDMATRLGKTAITAGNRPGFVVNRILVPMINEAILVFQEGLASAEDIDTGMRLGCNQPIGPLALADLIGLDTLLAIMEAFHEGFNDSKYRPAPLLKEMVAAGWLGRKSGRGFFTY